MDIGSLTAKLVHPDKTAHEKRPTARFMILIGLVLVLFMTGCEEATQEAAGTEDAATVVRGENGPTQTHLTSASTEATAPNVYADFDFAGGAIYPARAKVRIGNVNVAPGATVAHVPITIDRPTPNTVAARVATRNGSGWTRGFQGWHYTKVDTWVFFRPGDPLVQTVQIPIRNIDVGRQFDLIFPSGVVGGIKADGRGKITGVAGAAPSNHQTDGFRKPRSFLPTGALVYRLDPSSVAWTDGGTATAWSTRLPHGRTQPSNAETGLYLDPVLHQSPQPPIAIENGVIVLRSQQLSTRIRYDDASWKHGAAVLSGQNMPATQIRYGQYEWEAMMPNRRGAFPALWLLPTSGWPPEIDVYEGIGYSNEFDFTKHISGNLHGGRGSERTFVVPMRLDAMSAYGLTGFDRSYHRFAVDIAPDFITWFVDGREVFQAVNPFRGTSWFPIMTVAVKRQGEYVGGSGEMRVRSLSVWSAPD